MLAVVRLRRPRHGSFGRWEELDLVATPNNLYCSGHDQIPNIRENIPPDQSFQVIISRMKPSTKMSPLDGALNTAHSQVLKLLEEVPNRGF